MMRRPLSPSRQELSSLLFLVAALLIGVLSACSGGSTDSESSGNPGKGVYVPLEWQTDRQVLNHKVHVAREHVACAKCHDIGTDSMGGPVAPARCASCHAKQAHFEHARKQAQSSFGPDTKAVCTTCHVFKVDAAALSVSSAALAHDGGEAGTHAETAVPAAPHVPAPTDCTRCHGTRPGEAPAVQVHGTSECVKCHRPHEDVRGLVGPCQDCHRDISTGHGKKTATPGEACVTCHAHQHAPASDALGSCTGCHAKTEPIIPTTALFASGHTACVGCHRPHEFTKASAAPCRSCHADVHVLGAPKVAAHERCESCHAPHDVRSAGDAVCANCHKDVSPDHPKVAAASCTGCHNPHPTGATALERRVLARPCSACHQQAASDAAFHGGIACEKCHAPHRFEISLQDHALCAGCHKKQTTLTATLLGHQQCQGCHQGLPHRPMALEAPCGSCHKAEAAVARPGHIKCQSCHEPHDGSLVADCKTCHSAEQRSAPVGHQTCTGCHDQHSGKVAAAPCAKCHLTEAASMHGKVAEGCTSCHRPHGPSGIASPPACTSCHEKSKLPGLHALAQHQACQNCHKAHDEKPTSLRALCVTCHKDRQDHFPNAPMCGSCHLFGAAH
jgi:hypothetical protein